MITRLRNYTHPIVKAERLRSRLARLQAVPKTLYPIVADSIARPNTDVFDIDYLCIDFETTGLNPMIDKILSMGLVELKGGHINLATASHTYIKGAKRVKGETAVINHIVPELLEGGIYLDDAMEMLFRRMQGKVILAHGLSIEQRFIYHYLIRRYNIKKLPWLWIDTLRLERSLLENQMNPQGISYQLNMLRERYGLPDYAGHNALTDAISTAELFLAQLPKIYGQTKERPYEVVIRRST